jgi:hypothetical protein
LLLLFYFRFDIYGKDTLALCYRRKKLKIKKSLGIVIREKQNNQVFQQENQDGYSLIHISMKEKRGKRIMKR